METLMGSNRNKKLYGREIKKLTKLLEKTEKTLATE
jgi:hypothetical protein